MMSHEAPIQHAVLFDLDNTLILFDETRFFQAYLPSIARYFRDMMDEDHFTRRLLASTQALLKNDGTVTNDRIFMQHFTGKSWDSQIWERFLSYYREAFDSFRTLTRPTPGVVHVMKKLQRLPLRIIIASNPLWPRMIQEKRLHWAGLDNFHFDLITHIENMSFCKPSLGYYRQICGKTDLQPQNCFMVGNDPENDMIAAEVGMKTFLTMDSEAHQTAHLTISREIRSDRPLAVTPPDFQGLLKEVPAVIMEWLRESGRIVE